MRVGLDGRYMRDDFPGIGRYVYNLARTLPAVAPDVSFVLLHDSDAPNSRYDVAALRWSNLSLAPTDVRIRSIAEQVYLPQLVRRLALDVFHAPYYVTAYWVPCRQVVTIYDVISKRYPEYLPSPPLRLVFEATTRLALRTSNRILTLSEASRRDLVELYGIDPGRIIVTPLAAGSQFRPAPAETIAELKRRLGLPDRYVLYVGINKPHKNLVRLIEGWRQISESYGSDWRLVIAGHEDARYPHAREAAQGLDNVSFLGPVPEDDLPALYSGAELFVFPSLYEGFGLPVIEAMACGTPVVCSNTSSLPEVAGDATVYFDPTDVSDIATAIRRLLDDAALRSALRQRGLKQAKKFSWRQTARLTLQAYRVH